MFWVCEGSSAASISSRMYIGAEYKANGVEDVGLARAVQAGDRIELRVPAQNLRPVGVRFEPVEDELLDVHIFF